MSSTTFGFTHTPFSLIVSMQIFCPHTLFFLLLNAFSCYTPSNTLKLQIHFVIHLSIITFSYTFPTTLNRQISIIFTHSHPLYPCIRVKWVRASFASLEYAPHSMLYYPFPTAPTHHFWIFFIYTSRLFILQSSKRLKNRILLCALYRQLKYNMGDIRSSTTIFNHHH